MREQYHTGETAVHFFDSTFYPTISSQFLWHWHYKPALRSSTDLSRSIPFVWEVLSTKDMTWSLTWYEVHEACWDSTADGGGRDVKKRLFVKQGLHCNNFWIWGGSGENTGEHLGVKCQRPSNFQMNEWYLETFLAHYICTILTVYIRRVINPQKIKQMKCHSPVPFSLCGHCK